MTDDSQQPDINRNDLLPATIFMGLVAVGETIIPVLTWYLYISPRGYGNETWTRNSWMTLWIGNIATYGLAALMWPLSYAHDSLAKVYGWAWGWAKQLEGVLMLVIMAMLLVSGIQVPTDKTVWETLVVYLVVQMVMGGLAMAFAEQAMLWYSWGNWEEWTEDELEWCVQDQNGQCIECQDGDENCLNGYQVAELYWAFGF